METCLLQLKEYNHSVLEYIGNYCQEAGLKLLHLKEIRFIWGKVIKF